MAAMTTTAAAYSHSPRSRWRPANSKLSCSVLLGVLFGLCTFAGALGLAGFVYVQDADFVLPGVSMRGRPLGGLSAAEAEEAVHAAWDATLPTIDLVAGDRAWPTSANELGLTIDARLTAELALNAGRRLDTLNIAHVLLEGANVTPVVAVDPIVARQTLVAWAATIDTPPQDASFRLEGGQAVVVPARAGQALDVESTIVLLKSEPGRVIETGVLPLMMQSVEPQIVDVSADVAQVNALLATPLAVNVYDPITDERFDWSPSPETITEWLSVQSSEAGRVITVERESVVAYVAGQSEMLGAGRSVDAAEAAVRIAEGVGANQPITLLVRHSPTTYVVQPDDNLTQIGFKVGMPYWYIVQANPELEYRGLEAGQTLTIPSKDDLLPLPIVINRRIVVSIGQQRLWTFENRRQLNEYVISTGIARSPTQPGVFQVQTHELNAYASIWDLWMPHFMGIYEPVPGLMNGFHGLPTLSNGNRLWADVLGQPASYGCIILDLANAETLYNWAEAGVVVEIRD